MFVIGCIRGIGLQIVRQLAARGASVRGIARDPANARAPLPATSPTHHPPADRVGRLLRDILAVDITRGVGGRGFFKPERDPRCHLSVFVV